MPNPLPTHIECINLILRVKDIPASMLYVIL